LCILQWRVSVWILRVGVKVEGEREREKGKPCMAVKRMAAITFVGLSRTHLGERSLRI